MVNCFAYWILIFINLIFRCLIDLLKAFLEVQGDFYGLLLKFRFYHLHLLLQRTLEFVIVGPFFVNQFLILFQQDKLVGQCFLLIQVLDLLSCLLLEDDISHHLKESLSLLLLEFFLVSPLHMWFPMLLWLEDL